MYTAINHVARNVHTHCRWIWPGSNCHSL